MEKYIKYEEDKKYSIATTKAKAEVSRDISSFENAGYILNDNELVIDIDNVDKKVLEKMISIFDINTQYVWTDRGVHLYYKKEKGFRSRAEKICSLGFNIEFKYPKKSDRSYTSVTLKRNGKVREIHNQGVREDVPDIFLLTKDFKDLQGLSDNEGRNNSLFKLRSQLSTLKNWRTILDFVNDYIFDTPLPENEMEVLKREDRKSTRLNSSH